jgi:hypothetical protein
MKIEIDLTFDRKYFEEIYYKDFRTSYFKSPSTKVPFRNLLLGTITLIVFYCYARYEDTYSLFIVGIIIFATLLWSYLAALNTIIKWKKSIIAYLDREEKYEKNKIILSDDYFTLIQDSNEVIEHWSNFKHAEITETHMRLEAKETFLIPKSCMADAEYELLKHTISDKMK